MGGSSGGGGSSQPQQVTQTVTQFPEEARPYYGRLLSRGEAESWQPYAAYPSQRLSEFTPEEEESFQMAGSLARQGTPWAMQQAQQNPQAMQQLQQQQDQLVNQKASEQAKMEAQMIKQLAADEEARISREAQDPLVKLKQQEIDLKAMQTQMELQKDMMVEGEKMDIERDKLEADTSISLMKVAADVNKEDSTEAMALLKENMANTREAMKNQAAEKVRSNGSRSKKTNGQT